MEERNSKKPYIKNYLLYALSAFSAISFLWVCFIATGLRDNNSTTISAFAERLVISDLAIALFSVVFGASFMLLRAKKLSPQVKRFLHIIVNYVASMVCVYALFSNVNDVKINTWLVFFVFATAIYFAVYGIVALVVFLINRKK